MATLSGGVSLIIPAHNEQEVIGRCLEAAVPLLERGEIEALILVDDGSTDRTPEIVKSFAGVTYVRGKGEGAAKARNLGASLATTPLLWFVDADCVLAADALRHLRPHLDDAEVAGVSGTYRNMREGQWLPTLIHEEIVQRHEAMAVEVDFLATFNVLYRREVFEALGGFDPAFLKGQDAEFAFRVRRAGHKLHFEIRSHVGHFHENSLRTYLKVQRAQGYYRILMYRRHPERMAGDSYSGTLDHIQPPLAVLSAGLPLMGPAALAAPLATLMLVAAPVPMALKLVRRTGDLRQLGHVPMSAVRAYARGLGLCHGVLDAALSRGGFANVSGKDAAGS